jgi:hypothetical protein
MATDRSLPETERNWLRVLSTQNEYQARLLVAQRALELGRGGISRVSELTGMSRPTIYRGIEERRTRKKWESSTRALRIRQAGGGRRALSESDPEFLRAL